MYDIKFHSLNSELFGFTVQVIIFKPFDNQVNW